VRRHADNAAGRAARSRLSALLTPRQGEVLDFLRERIERTGRAPTYDEIRGRFGFRSYNSVQTHLAALEERGAIRRGAPNAKRSIAVVPEPPLAVRLPLAGTIAAGRPIEPVEEEDAIEVPASLVGRGPHFVLRVAGDSMIGDGIHDGDLVLVRKGETAESGETVVAILDGEATLKRFHRTREGIELRPANPTLAPIPVGRRRLEIRGVVVGLVRTFRRSPPRRAGVS
jgi:repressor LexA